MKIVHRLASLLLFLLAVLLVALPFAVAFAQQPVKTNVLPLFDKVPAPPTAFNPALKRPAAKVTRPVPTTKTDKKRPG